MRVSTYTPLGPSVFRRVTLYYREDKAVVMYKGVKKGEIRNGRAGFILKDILSGQVKSGFWQVVHK